jgi:flagellar motor protein MotB
MRSFLAHRMARLACSTALLLATGCSTLRSANPVALNRDVAQLKQSNRQYQDQLAQAKIRADNLDADNESLHNLLAQEQSETRRLRGQLANSARPAPAASSVASSSSGFKPVAGDTGTASPSATGSTSSAKAFGPARDRSESSWTRTEPSTSVARSTPRESPARRSSGGSGWLPLASVSGAEVVRDGDTVRIRVTNTSLFDPGKATLKPSAKKVLDGVAGAIKTQYAGLLVGIEGHTDSDPIKRSKWKDNHDLSVQRALAVYEYLRTQGGVRNDQIFVAGFGPNQPIASNASTSGKAQNRRVEFVVHPTEARMANQTRSRR